VATSEHEEGGNVSSSSYIAMYQYNYQTKQHTTSSAWANMSTVITGHRHAPQWLQASTVNHASYVMDSQCFDSMIPDISNGGTYIQAIAYQPTRHRTSTRPTWPSQYPVTMLVQNLSNSHPWVDTPSYTPAYGRGNFTEGMSKWPHTSGQVHAILYTDSLFNDGIKESDVYSFDEISCISYETYMKLAIQYHGLESNYSIVPKEWKNIISQTKWTTYQFDFDNQSRVFDDENVTNGFRYVGLFEEIVYTQVYASSVIYGTVLVQIQIPEDDKTLRQLEASCVIDYRRTHVSEPTLLSNATFGNIEQSMMPYNQGKQAGYQNFTNFLMQTKDYVELVTTVKMRCEARYGHLTWLRNALILHNENGVQSLSEYFVFTAELNFTRVVPDMGQKFSYIFVTKNVCNIVYGPSMRRNSTHVDHTPDVYLIDCFEEFIDDDKDKDNNDLKQIKRRAHMWEVWPMTFFMDD
jgi:hypothetical protein